MKQENNINQNQDKPKSVFTKQRALHRRAYKHWSDKDYELLWNLFHQGKSTKEIAIILKRGDGAIRSKLRKLGFKHLVE